MHEFRCPTHGAVVVRPDDGLMHDDPTTCPMFSNWTARTCGEPLQHFVHVPTPEPEPTDHYLRLCSREAIVDAVRALRDLARRIVPNYTDLDPMNAHDEVKALFAEHLDAVAGAIESYEYRASGEAAIDAALNEVDLPLRSEHNVSILESRSIDEWEVMLDERRDRKVRIEATGVRLESGTMLADHFEAMVLEAEAGLAWQRSRRLWALHEPEGHTE